MLARIDSRVTADRMALTVESRIESDAEAAQMRRLASDRRQTTWLATQSRCPRRVDADLVRLSADGSLCSRRAIDDREVSRPGESERPD